MKKPKDIESKVMEILQKYPESRRNDFALYARYIQENNAELRDVGLIYALMQASALNMPNYESVTRARRKIQQQHPDLKPPKKTRELRGEREKMFREYAKQS